jgi:hypothetical protein
MNMNIYFVMAFLTLLLSLAVIIVTLARLHCGKCKRTRLKYTIVLLASLVAWLQPYFFNQLPGLSNVLLVLSVLWLLIDGSLSVKDHRKVHPHKDDQLIDIVIDKGQ